MSGILLDTCAIIWTFENASISARSRAVIGEAAEAGELFVSAVSAWEIGMLASEDRKRPLRLGASPEAAFDAVLALPGIRCIEIDYRCTARSTHLPSPIHSDPADRLLIATARDRALTIVTRDRKILTYAALGHVRAVRC